MCHPAFSNVWISEPRNAPKAVPLNSWQPTPLSAVAKRWKSTADTESDSTFFPKTAILLYGGIVVIASRLLDQLPKNMNPRHKDILVRTSNVRRKE